MSTTSPSPDVSDGPVGSRRGAARAGADRAAGVDVEPRGQRPGEPVGPRRAALHPVRPRDAGAGRLDQPQLQRRAALPQADPDLLADARRVRAGGRQPVRRPARLGAGRGGDVPGHLGAGTSNARAPGGSARRADAGDGADHGHRVEAGDDRRHADALAGRRPVLPLGAGAAAIGRVRGGILGADGAGVPDQGAGRAGADRRRGAGLLVVGRADRVLAAAPMAPGAAPLPAPDRPLVRGRRPDLARRVLPVRARQSGDQPRGQRDGGARRPSPATTS